MVVTVPLKNYRVAPAEFLAGKVVLDTNNYYPQRDGRIIKFNREVITSSELLQERCRARKSSKRSTTFTQRS